MKTVIFPWKVVEICLSKFVWTMIQYGHVSFNLLMKWHCCYSKSIFFLPLNWNKGLLHVLMMDAPSNQEIMVKKIIRTCLRNLESKNNVKRKENWFSIMVALQIILEFKDIVAIIIPFFWGIPSSGFDLSQLVTINLRNMLW